MNLPPMIIYQLDNRTWITTHDHISIR